MSKIKWSGTDKTLKTTIMWEEGQWCLIQIIKKLLNSRNNVRLKGKGLKTERCNTKLENQISNIRNGQRRGPEKGIACGYMSFFDWSVCFPKEYIKRLKQKRTMSPVSYWKLLEGIKFPWTLQVSYFVLLFLGIIFNS
jgi:hypothetical protein